MAYIDIAPTLSIFNRNKVKSDLIYDLDLYRENIKNILKTNTKERLWNIDFGSNLYSYLFNIQGASISLLTTFKTRLYDLIQKYEPNVNIQNVIVIPDFDKNTINIKILFSKIYDDSEGIKVKETTESYSFEDLYGGIND